MLLPRPQAQCTNHMHLPTALELVYEMRQRNVSPNTHTYSSMLNVCVKAGELDLALDVFNQVGVGWGVGAAAAAVVRNSVCAAHCIVWVEIARSRLTTDFMFAGWLLVCALLPRLPCGVGAHGGLMLM